MDLTTYNGPRGTRARSRRSAPPEGRRNMLVDVDVAHWKLRDRVIEAMTRRLGRTPKLREVVEAAIEALAQREGVLALALFLFLSLQGCATTGRAPLPGETLTVVGIQHTSLYDEHHTTGARSQIEGAWSCTYDPATRLVTTPAEVALPMYDSRQIRSGRRTWWLANEPESVTDEEAAWTIAAPRTGGAR